MAARIVPAASAALSLFREAVERRGKSAQTTTDQLREQIANAEKAGAEPPSQGRREAVSICSVLAFKAVSRRG
jgi:hypothetical protein